MPGRTGLSRGKKHAASLGGLPPSLIVSENSRPDGHRNRCIRWNGRSAILGSTTNLTHTGARFQKRNFAAGQAAVMHKVLTQGTTRPPAAEKRFVAVEPFLADLTVPGFNPQQHRLPFPSAFSDTHTVKYSEAVSGKTRSLTKTRVAANLLAHTTHGLRRMGRAA